MSVVKCTVIVRPLTHYTIFTDRVLRTIISTIWMLNLVICGAINFGVNDAYFDWISMVVFMERENPYFANAFGGVNIAVATVIIMLCYVKVFLVVRRQMRSKTSVSRPKSRKRLSCQDQDLEQNFTVCP